VHRGLTQQEGAWLRRPPQEGRGRGDTSQRGGPSSQYMLAGAGAIAGGPGQTLGPEHSPGTPRGPRRGWGRTPGVLPVAAGGRRRLRGRWRGRGRGRVYQWVCPAGEGAGKGVGKGA